MLTPKEKNAVRYIRDYGWTLHGACRRLKVNMTRLKAKPEFQAALDAPKVPAADPALASILEEIEARGKDVIVPERATASTDPQPPMPEPTATDLAQAELDATLAEIAAEQQMTQAEYIAKAYPPEFDVPVPGLHPEPRKFTTWELIKAGERGVEEARKKLGWQLYQEKHRRSGVGGDYVSQDELSRYARYKEQ